MTAVDDFTAVFQSVLLERTRRVLELLIPEKKPVAALPFAMTPAFIQVYSELYRVGIFPLLMSRRPVKALKTHFDWGKDGPEQLSTILDDRANPVFVAWDFAWDALWDEREPPKEAVVQKEQKKGLLKSLFGKKEAAKPTAKEAAAQPGQVLDGLYKMLNEHAAKAGYLPLLHDDLKAFKGLIRIHPARIREAWKELVQYHAQEFLFSSKEQVKTGALSEAMTKWQYTLPDRVGEFLVVKAAVDLEHCSKTFVQKYVRQAARTQEDADRAMPYLAAYSKTMPHVITR